MPVFRFNKASGVARGVKAFLDLDGGAAPDVERQEDQAENSEDTRQRMSEYKKRLEDKKRELSRVKKESRVSKDGAERIEYRKRIKRIEYEIFQLESAFHAAREQRAVDAPDGRTAVQTVAGEESGTGALPDFLIIGAQKSGTSSLYHHLSQHPLVESAASKEPHYFDLFFDEEDIEWYSRWFPRPKQKDGRTTITGEATPYYLFHPRVPGRMAKVIPEARLIALLRNPVDRAHSHYQQWSRRGRETRTFEEAIEAAEKPYAEYLSRGIYVDQLLRWSEFYSKEQLLVLKSEDFFEHPKDTLNVVLDFLDLPEWEPTTWEVRKKGSYERQMNPATKRRLEEYFEPHNERLYEFLGVDYGW